MKKTIHSLILAFGLVVAAEAADAAVVFNNGGPNGVSGNETTRWVQTEDFQLGGAAAISGAQVYIAGFGGIGNWDGTVNYFIFADNAGSPGTLLTSGAGQGISTSDTGAAWDFGGNTFLVEFDLVSAFNAAAATTYWFGVHLSTDFNEDSIYWVTTDPTTGNGNESAGGTFDNWFNNENEHAFALLGENTTTTPVPEPGSLALLGMGVAGLALVRRRRCRV